MMPRHLAQDEWDRAEHGLPLLTTHTAEEVGEALSKQEALPVQPSDAGDRRLYL